MHTAHIETECKNSHNEHPDPLLWYWFDVVTALRLQGNGSLPDRVHSMCIYYCDDFCMISDLRKHLRVQGE